MPLETKLLTCPITSFLVKAENKGRNKAIKEVRQWLRNKNN